MKSKHRIAHLFLAALLFPAAARAGDWPQFHGPGGSGIREDDDKGPALPEKIGPGENMLWRVPLPPGHSSPVVFGDKVFLTAVEGEKLLTIGLDAKSGAILWRDEAPHEKIEELHRSGNLAQPSPAANAAVVVSFFGSSGLSCYAHDGRLLWRKRMGPFNDGYGAGSSPVLCGGAVILNQDHDTDSFLAAYNETTGEMLWKTDRSEFPRGYSTPVIWDTPAGRHIAVAGTLRLAGYDFNGGKELWSVRGLARVVCPTPVIGPEGDLYLAIWAPGGDSGDRIAPIPFAEALARDDKNGDGAFQSNEPGDAAIRARFTQVDRDKDGRITETEYTSMRQVFNEAGNVAMRVRPGGSGDVTATHVVWRNEKMIPYVPSSIVYRGFLFMARNGGVVTALDAATGRAVKQARVEATGDYFSSPVAGDGKVYLMSDEGRLTVLSAEGEWRELYSAAFDEPSRSTPAITGGRIYVRTGAALYCFGNVGE